MILTGEYVSDIILMIQGHFQGQFELHICEQMLFIIWTQVGWSVITLFDVILTGEYVYLLISVIQGHLQDKKVENTLCVNITSSWHTRVSYFDDRSGIDNQNHRIWYKYLLKMCFQENVLANHIFKGGIRI